MTIGIGFLGTGFMGQLAHLHSYSQLPNCNIVAIAEARPRLARQVADRFAIPTVYASHEQLLVDDRVHAVICSQPYHRNHPLGRQVLQAGKHLFTEKPMAASVAHARELIDLAHARNLIYAVGFMKRFDPGIQAAQHTIADFIQSGELGRITMVDTTCFLGDWLQNPGRPIRTDEPPPVDDLQPGYPDFLPADLHAAYDHFLNIYSHNINLLHYLLPGRALSVASAHRQGQTFLVALQSDDLLISLRGTPSQSHQWEEQTSIYFERGRVVIHAATPLNRQAIAQVSIWRETANTWTEQRLFPPIEWSFLRQAKAFLTAITEGQPLPTIGTQCLADVQLMEDVFQNIISRALRQ